ncbi:MAG: lipopolysaccharide biosynthesis protein [Clostridia bacterium]|nr:lipopolysaccharide biosynthesis protein [Clostridia bacterium]
MNEKISLLYGGNDYAFDGIITSLLSVTKYCKQVLEVYIFTMDLSKKNPQWKPLSQKHTEIFDKILHQANPDSRTILMDMTVSYLDTLNNNINESTSYTPFTLLRLLADKTDLPDKVLYLDTDTIAMQDITILWNQDVEGYHFGAVLDHYGKVFISPKYINAGVLLLNLRQMNKDHVLEQCRELIRTKKLKFSDQSVLNQVSKGFIKYLPRKFNDQKRLHEDTVIRHFAKTIIWFPYIHTRNIKPWNQTMLHRYHIHFIDDILQRYLETKNKFVDENSIKN